MVGFNLPGDLLDYGRIGHVATPADVGVHVSGANLLGRLAVSGMSEKAVPERMTRDGEPTVLPFTPLVELEHLLKVTHSVTQDANKVWAEIWDEMKRMATPGGMILPEATEGFVPSCGWPEFLEKLWMLKHYLDYVQRLCASTR